MNIVIILLFIVSTVVVLFGVRIWKSKQRRNRLNFILRNYPLAAKAADLSEKLSDKDLKNKENLLKKSDDEWRKEEEQEKRIKERICEISSKFPDAYRHYMDTINNYYSHGNDWWANEDEKIKKEKERKERRYCLDFILENYPLAAKKYGLSANLSDDDLENEKEILANENDWWGEENRKIVENKVSKAIVSLTNAVKSGNVSGANEAVDKINKHINEVSPSIASKAENAIADFESDYETGLVPPQENAYVQYDAPQQFVQKVDKFWQWHYAVAKFPKRGCVVYPYRRRKMEIRGYTEQNFQNRLTRKLGTKDIEIISDCSIHTSENHHPFEPDIAIIVRNRSDIRIDIEIDEPYSLKTKKPIHCVNSKDDLNDEWRNNSGWIVIRFAEWQVAQEADECIAYVAQILLALDGSLSIPDLKGEPTPVERWTENQAKVWATECYRGNYLGITEIDTHEPEKTEKTFSSELTENERNAQAKVESPKIGEVKKGSGSFAFNRDGEIRFEPWTHSYMYKGGEYFMPASTVISQFFEEFDSVYWAERKASERNVPVGQILEEWDCKGAESREVGTFMHQQIENRFNGRAYNTDYDFWYEGEYVNEYREISLETEKSQFEQFLQNYEFSEVRTEFTIFDEFRKIAGTVDMIHRKQDGTYEIYDWKRTKKVIDGNGNVITRNSFGKTGVNGLERIPDTPYWHYCLQMNIYRFILQERYNISISRMYMVVFDKEQESYHRLQVPEMDEFVEIMMDNYEHCIEE